MQKLVGHVDALYRYPIKSMMGEFKNEAVLGWHGIEGDRRHAFRLVESRSDFPWLSASKLPELLLYRPICDAASSTDTPSHVRTPDGNEYPIMSEELAADVRQRLGAPVEMICLRNGIFDEASLSVIADTTVSEIGGLAGLAPDARRFRPNVVIRGHESTPFLEDSWVGHTLIFGEEGNASAVSVTMSDLRCSMINLDPDSVASDPVVLKSVARANMNNAGVYCSVLRPGRLVVGQPVYLRAESDS